MGHEMQNLLVISPEHYSFVKDQVEVMGPFFKNIYNLVRYNPFSEISTVMPINSLKIYRHRYLINKTRTPDNVKVFSTPVFYAPIERHYKNLGDKHYRSVEKTLKNEKISFDLIHSHFLWSSGHVGAKLKERYSVPHVVTAHGYDIYSLPFKDFSWKKKIESVLNSADATITVSNQNFELIKKLDVDTPVRVIPNGFRRDLFYPMDMAECRRILRLPRDGSILVTVGNLEAVKGHRYLIEAIGKVVRERKDVLCVFIGSGKEQNALKKQIRAAGLENHFFLAGSRSHEEIPRWMNACDLFVLSSLNEGNPTVMFESLGCGKPFVGTKVGGIPDIISSDKYGLLAEPADVDDIANKILMALERKWSQESIVDYAKKYTWDNICKDIINTYSPLL